MGGLYGHMYHLYDNPNLSFSDLYDIINKASSGKLIGTEKTDGQNLYVSFSIPNDKAVAARNKGEIKPGGIDADQLGDKFKGRGPLEYSFADALRAFESFARNLSTEMQNELFGASANRWYNIEVMNPDTTNVIQYDTKIVTIHRDGGMLRTEDGIKPDPSKRGIEFLEKIFKKVEDIAKQGEHKLVVNAVQKLKGLNDKSHARVAIGRLSKTIKDEGMSDDDTIGEYVIKVVGDETKKVFPSLKDSVRKMIVQRVMKVKGASLTGIYKQLDKDDGETKQLVKDFVNTAPLLLKRIIHPLEDAIHDFAVEMLRGVHSLYVLDNDAEVFRMRKEVEGAIRAIEQTGDEDELGKLKMQVDKLKDLENVSSAAEGFVFNYDGNTYKFTGNFAPINQIMGILRYGKGAASRTINEEGGEGQTIALFPGGFKPPHSGHFQAAEAGMNKADKVYVIVSEKERDGITFDISRWLWEKYIAKYGYQGRMICVGHTELVKGSRSPIQTTYDYVKKLDPGTNVVLVLGKKDIEDGRYAGVGKDREDLNVSMYAVKFGGISGTKMRNFAKDGDAISFMKNLPAKFKNDERKEMYEMVKSNVLSETPESSVIAKQPKDPIRVGIGRNALYNLVEDLYNEVAPELGNAPKDYNPLYAEETFKFIFDKSIPEETKDKFMDLVEKDPRAAIQFLVNYKNETNEVSSVVGGSVEGYAGPFRGKKKKKKTT
tara:strand:- start:168994 stop:171135 length:2142 start_codon:yes stop_codon:yes gene_type:complete